MCSLLPSSLWPSAVLTQASTLDSAGARPTATARLPDQTHDAALVRGSRRVSSWLQTPSSVLNPQLCNISGVGMGRVSKVLRAGMFIHGSWLFFSGMRPSMYTVEPLHVLLL
eukprot:scaffold9103_cov124-Isochrysis_galbana.AAC.3